VRRLRRRDAALRPETISDASDTLSEHSPSSSHGSSGEEEGEDEVLGMHPWLLDTPEENQLHEQAWQALEQGEPRQKGLL